MLPVARQHGMAVLGMKSFSNGLTLRTDTVTAVEALHYAMSAPVTVTITGCDSEAILEQALGVARNFEPMEDAEELAVLRRTATVGGDGRYEAYKSLHIYDGTMNHPQLLG